MFDRALALFGLQRRAATPAAGDWYAQTWIDWRKAGYSGATLLSAAAAFRAIDIIASVVASLPRGQAVGDGDPLLAALDRAGGAFTTGQMLLYAMVVRCCLTGLAHAVVERGRDGLPARVWMADLSEEQRGGALVFRDGGGRRWRQEDVVRLVYVPDVGGAARGDFLAAFRAVVGELVAGSNAGRTLTERGRQAIVADGGGSLLSAAETGDLARNMAKQLDEGGALILPPGYKPAGGIGMGARDLQIVELRENARREAAAAFGVPSSLIADQRDDPRGQAWRVFVQTTITAWAGRVEAALAAVMSARPRLMVERLLRPDMGARAEAYEALRRASIATVNECRKMEGLPALDDPRADDPCLPINKYQPTGAAATGGGAE